MPGLIGTSLVEGLRVSRKTGNQEAYESTVKTKAPMGRLWSVWDVDYAVGFLCSEVSGYLTGHELVVDGGLSCAAG
jgi:NAD(P)-dependent dehydrogenase (short-subunit alcohol dehydrogenase family)